MYARPVILADERFLLRGAVRTASLLFAWSVLALACRSSESASAGSDGTTGVSTDGTSDGTSESGETGADPSKPEPPDLPPPEGADEPGCYAGIRKLVVDAGPVTGLALWSDGATRVVAGTDAIRHISGRGDETRVVRGIVDAAIVSNSVAYVLTQTELMHLSAMDEELIFKENSSDFEHRYGALAVTGELEAVIVGDYTYCSQEDEFSACLSWLTRGAFWRVPNLSPRTSSHHELTSVASHSADEAIIAGPGTVGFVGSSESSAVAVGDGRVWLDPQGGYFIAVDGSLHHYVPGEDILPVDVFGIESSERYISVGRDAGGLLRAVVADDDHARVLIGEDLSTVALVLPPDRTAAHGAFSRGPADEAVVSSPLGAEVWAIDGDQPTWDANTPFAGRAWFHLGLRPDGTGFAVNADSSLFSRDATGRWSVVAEVPIDAIRVLPWGESGAMLAGETALFEWTGSSFIDHTPEIGTEQIQDVMVRDDELWVLSRTVPKASSSVFYRRSNEPWSKAALSHSLIELVPGADGPLVFARNGGGTEWSDGDWIDIEANYWWRAWAHAETSTKDIYAIIRFSLGWGVGRLDRATGEWSVEPVPARDWQWISANGSEVWVLAGDAAAYFDGQAWRVRAFPQQGAAGRALTDDGVVVHEHHQVARIETCDE